MHKTVAAIREFFKSDLQDLTGLATVIDSQPRILKAAVPGAKTYRGGFYQNEPHSFLHASITGGACALN